MDRHPEHDAVARRISEWYTRPYPEMGYHLERRRFGFYCRNVKTRAASGRVMVRDLEPAEVETFASDLCDYFGERPVNVWVDDAQLDEWLGPALIAAGCRRGTLEVFLAQVGEAPPPPVVSGLQVEAVAPAALPTFARTKIMAFSSSETPPSPSKVEAEIAIRKAELGGPVRLLVACMDGEPAGVLAWHDDEGDRFVNQVATRVPFRGRGIARHLICTALADARDAGRRAVVISVDVASGPVLFYRRLGFVDEVYRRQGYFWRGVDAVTRRRRRSS